MGRITRDTTHFRAAVAGGAFALAYAPCRRHSRHQSGGTSSYYKYVVFHLRFASKNFTPAKILLFLEVNKL